MSLRGLNTTRLFLSRAVSSAQKATSATAERGPEGVKYIPPYKTNSGWSFVERPNRVKMYQEIYGMDKSSDPVYLRGGRSDLLLYRGIMGLSVVGIGVALYSIYRMATGKIEKKES